jgi:hypothetical protein
MIIKMIPETDEERQRYKNKGVSEIEHKGIREFIIFGNKIDGEGDLADFHEWHGSYRYLMGSLNYFYEVINDNRRAQSLSSVNETTTNLRIAEPPTGHPMIKRGKVTDPDVHLLDISKLQEEPIEFPSIEEAGAFEEEEARAVEKNEQYMTLEDLEAEANKIRKQNESDNEINPQGLRIVKD